jgi:ABC-type Mn2+/Zn2+ transport system permease subunit
VWFGLGIIGLIMWFAIALWPVRVAARKRHSFIGYFILSLFFSSARAHHGLRRARPAAGPRVRVDAALSLRES